MVEDLPAPLGPSSARHSPACTPNDSRRTATVAPAPCPKTFRSRWHPTSPHPPRPAASMRAASAATLESSAPSAPSPVQRRAAVSARGAEAGPPGVSV